jgi:hypothetical protein
MLAYELYTFDQVDGYELMGVLPERRKNPRRMTEGSVTNWGRILLGGTAENKSIYFKKVTLNNNGRILWAKLDINSNTITFQ